MKKKLLFCRSVFCLFFCLLISKQIYAQDPYIDPSVNLGKYGYLEKDASTKITLNSNTHSNIRQLFGRTWINSGEQNTYGTAVNVCNSTTNVPQDTNDFTFIANSGASAGQIAFTSAKAEYCDGVISMGYNERQHVIFDVSVRSSDNVSTILPLNNSPQVVLSLKIDFGSLSDRTLKRLWIKNSGNLVEGTELPNNAFEIYYENATGSEVFNGNESMTGIFGDFSGNATNNNEFGSDNLNINIPANGLRVYVVLKNMNCFSGSKNLAISLMNDGLSFLPSMDGSYQLARVGETPLVAPVINTANVSSVTSALSGDYYVPSPCLPTLASAATALNTYGVSGPVTINVSAGHTETAPTGGITFLGSGAAGNLATGTSANPIVIKKYGTGNNPTITAPVQNTTGSTYSDAIIKIIGGDYITIDGLTLNERTTGTLTYTGTTNNVTEFGVALFYATTTNGAQNNTIKNCVIDMDINGNNSYGIYSNNTHSATAPTISAPSTGIAGSNSNLTLIGNTIRDVNSGIAFIGSSNLPADMNDGLVIGGSIENKNTLSNFGRAQPLNSFNLVSGTINGIIVRNTKNYNISYNTINNTDIATAPTLSTLRGIFVDTYSNVPSGVFSNNISYNKISLKSSGSSVEGIMNSATSGVPVDLNINNNEFSNFTVTGTNATKFIQNNQNGTNININENVFNNIITASTGNVTFITNSTSLISGGIKNVNNNKIVTGFTKTGAGGTVTIYTDNGASVSGSTVYNIGNDFSNITIPSTTTINGWVNTDFNTATSMPTKFIENNKFENWSVSNTGPTTVMDLNGFGGTYSTILNNFISNISKSGANNLFGINIGSRGVAGVLDIKNNTIQNLVGGTSTLHAISDINPSTIKNIDGNTIKNISGPVFTLNLINHQTNTNTVNIINNIIDQISSSSTATFATIRCINQSAAATVKIDNNTITNVSLPHTIASNYIYGISCTNANISNLNSVSDNIINTFNGGSTVNTAQVMGIYTSGSGNFEIKNNIINNIIGNSSTIGNNTSSALIGISNASSGTNHLISGNKIYDLKLNNTSNNNNVATAIATNSTLAGGLISKNIIYNIINLSTGTNPFIVGYMPGGGNWTVANNMISLDNGSNTNGMQCTGVFDSGSAGSRKYYYNTFYISGNSSASHNSAALQFNTPTSSGTAEIRNNILDMRRTGGGKNYAFAIGGSTNADLTKVTSDYNIFNSTVATNNVAQYISSAFVSKDFVTWQATGKDANSYTAEPISYVNTAIADLHLNITNDCDANNIEGAGIAVAVVTDYDSETRTNNPDIGADEVDFARVVGDTPAPDITKRAIVKTDYTTNRFECKCLQVNKNKTLTIAKDTDVTVDTQIVNNGNIIVKSDGNLIQIKDNATFTGNNISVERLVNLTTARKEYNYFTSPVDQQNLKTIYPNIDQVLYYRESNNKFYASTGGNIVARGLAVKEPNASYVGSTTTAEFKGKPYNGILSFTLQNSNVSNVDNGYNLVGNPYPSKIDLDELYALNNSKIESVFYFWDSKANDIYTQMGSLYTGNAYAIYNAATGTTTGTGIPAAGSGSSAPGGPTTAPQGTKIPNKNTAVAQGFIVKALANNVTLDFKNSIRNAEISGESFYGKNGTDSKYWLTLQSPSGKTNTIAVAYFQGGNNGFQKDDVEALFLSSDAIYSFVDNKKTVINGRSPFIITDKILLGTDYFENGVYTISVIKKEGVFSNGQSIYLKDKLLGTITEITENAYSYATTPGTFDARFEIVYQPETILGTDNTIKNGIKVYRSNNDFVIKSHEKIEFLEVYDASGRLIAEAKVNSEEYILQAENFANGLYVLKIKTKSEIISKKISK